MREKTYENILWLSLSSVMVFAPLARGGMRLWAQAIIQTVIFSTLFMWLFFARNRKPWKNIFKRTKMDLPVAIFVLMSLVSMVFSIYRYASVQGILRLFVYVGIFYLIVNNFNEKYIKKYVFVAVITGTGLSLLGIGQYFFDLDHSWWVPQSFLSSTFVNHNHFAGFLEMAIPLTMGLLFSELCSDRSRTRGMYIRIVLFLCMSVMFVSFVLSQSRGAWISLGATLVFMAVFFLKKRILSRTAVIIFSFIVLTGIIYVYAGYDNTSARMSSLENIESDASLLTRITIWKGSLRIIIDNLLYGTGIGTFERAFPAYRPEGLNVKAYYAHNDYLHMMSETGILALPLMLWMLFILSAAGLKAGLGYENNGRNSLPEIKHMDGIVLGSVAGVLSLSLHGIMDFNFHIVSNMIFFSVLAGIIIGADLKRKNNIEIAK